MRMGRVSSLAGVWVMAASGAAVATAGTPGSDKKWVGPVVGSPAGGQVQTTIYYGPWKCSQAWMDRCQRKCDSEGYALMGCIWLADIKADWQTRFALLPVSGGGRLAITHCCCNYPKAPDAKSRRAKWEAVMRAFRKKWGEEFGGWPTDAAGNNWHGHHIRDLGHGGDPIAEYNVLPVSPTTHDAFTDAYPACYAGQGGWNTVGPERPYVD